MPQIDELRRFLVRGLFALVLSLLIFGGNGAAFAQDDAKPAASTQTTTAAESRADSKEEAKDQAKDQASPGERDEEKLPLDAKDSTPDRDLEDGAKDLQAQKDNLFIQLLFVSVAVVLVVIALAIWMSQPRGKKKKGTSA